MSAPAAEIDEVARRFFSAFTNRSGPPDIDSLYELCLPQAVVTRSAGATLEIFDLKQFAEPRRQLLSGGRLVDFAEEETGARTEIFGNIAQRWCTYRKAGVLDGRPFTGKGTKTLQLVRLAGRWRISAVAWEDEP